MLLTSKAPLLLDACMDAGIWTMQEQLQRGLR